MSDIDELSRRVPCICKVAPNGDYLMEDVHRAGGIPAILGELHRGGLLNEDVHTVHAATLDEWLDDLGRRAARGPPRRAVELFHAAPGCVRSASAFSQSERWDVARPRRAPKAASTTSSTPTRPKAAWRSSTATSPSAAAWSRPPASTSRC